MSTTPPSENIDPPSENIEGKPMYMHVAHKIHVFNTVAGIKYSIEETHSHCNSLIVVGKQHFNLRNISSASSINYSYLTEPVQETH